MLHVPSSPETTLPKEKKRKKNRGKWSSCCDLTLTNNERFHFCNMQICLVETRFHSSQPLPAFCPFRYSAYQDSLWDYITFCDWLKEWVEWLTGQSCSFKGQHQLFSMSYRMNSFVDFITLRFNYLMVNGVMRETYIQFVSPSNLINCQSDGEFGP